MKFKTKITSIAIMIMLMAIYPAKIFANSSNTTAKTYSVTTDKKVVRKIFGRNSIAWGTSCRESGFQAAAYHYNTNGSIDRGLFQINSIHMKVRVHYWSPIQNRAVDITIGYVNRGRTWIGAKVLYRPVYNARVAWAMSRGGTYWQAWNGGTTYCALGYS